MTPPAPLVSVVQPGARLHYAMPRIFAEAGMLRALHTDLHAGHRWLRALDRGIPQDRQSKPLRRLLGRTLPEGLPAGLVRDRPVETVLRTAAGLFGATALDQRAIPAALLRDLEASAIGAGDIVYTVLINEDLDAMARLKARGVKIVHECIIGPDVGLLMAEEAHRFPGIEPAPDLAEIAIGRARDARKYALSDLILVPSTFTAAAVADLNPDRRPVANVPYGFDLASYPGTADPDVGRVLFVGSVGLRKGNPDLAAAARLLAVRDRTIRVRVVGPSTPEMIAAPVMHGPDYVGQVPRARIFEEYRRADVFVLPTICDSFGIVLLEAMAAGVPVVTTPNCGDIVRDGIDGFIVPPREPGILAERIAQIVGDRALRARLSDNARQRVRAFSLDAYRARLLAAIATV